MSRPRTAWQPLLLAAFLLAMGLPRNSDAASARQTGRVRPGEVLVELRDGADADTVARRSGAARRTHVRSSVHRLTVRPGEERARAEALQRDPDVVAAAPDYMRSALDVTPNDAFYSQQWWLPKIAAPTAWESTTGSPTIKVAVLDSGADLTHPDLQGNLAPGTNTLGVEPGAVSPGCGVTGEQDDYGHGTHVAGIAAAVGNNGVGVASVAWNAKIQPVKVLDCTGNGSDAQIIAGIDWAIANGSNVLNLSLGGPEPSSVLDAAIDRAWRAGIVVTAAAGNQGSNIPFYPAASPGALAVAATNQSDGRPSFSNYGSFVALAAPGDSILSTTNGGGYGTKSGTSMASPVVAGAAALVWAAHPNYRSDQIVAALIVTADKVGTAGYDETGRNDFLGHGRINVTRALTTERLRVPLALRGA
jgi:thermitase